MAVIIKPSDIEQNSMSIIASELEERGITLPPEHEAVVKRVIHTTADFDYAETLRFTEGAVEKAVTALSGGCGIVTDTNMAKAGVSKPALKKLGGDVACFMADPDVAAAAKKAGTTRAVMAMRHASKVAPKAVYAIGNAPTALLQLAELIRETDFRPALIIGVPVGFVNVVESKEELFRTCEEYGVPCIAAMGRKGGSNVAAAVCNALLYAAADLQNPEERNWKT
ncbi:MAG: precorrin-8X methylmutase [Clostridia bacterium]|nr:precorrin-8X methylmutase [Clostridia bacterium]MBR1705054.1 precorrin-8X methylmutase [Clostridia bacterium]